MCSDERSSGRIEMQSETNRNEIVAEGNFVHFDEIGGEEEENEESGDLWSLGENKQDELLKKGNFMHFNQIGDEKEENRKSGGFWRLCENNQNELVKNGNFMYFSQIGDEKEENKESGDLWRLCENNQNEIVKEGNFVHCNEIRDEEVENEESGDLWNLCENNQNDFVKEGNSIHFNQIPNEEEENEESGDLWSLCENNQNELVKERNFMHFNQISDGEEQKEESEDLWSLCEPAKSHGEFLLGHDGLSPVSNTEPHGTRKNIFSNNSLHFCTESLGFESSDERDDCNAAFTENMGKFMEEEVQIPDAGSVTAEKCQYATSQGHMGAKKGATFPPPLTWLKSSLLLKPLRKDGRFLLREVEEAEAPLPRHEILHTWRQNGRLRLHLTPLKNLNFINTSAEIDTSSSEDEVNGMNDQPSLTSSLSSVDEGSAPRSPERWDATWENKCVGFPRADVSLPLFVVSLDRCQESTTCLSTWSPRCITI